MSTDPLLRRQAFAGLGLLGVAVVWFLAGFVGLTPPLADGLLGAGADLLPLTLTAFGLALVAPAIPDFIAARRPDLAKRVPQGMSAPQLAFGAWATARVLIVLIGLRAVVGDGLVGDVARAIISPVASLIQVLLIVLIVVVLLWLASLVLMGVLRVKRTVNGTQAGMAEAGAGFGATASRWVAGQLTRLVAVVVGRGGAAVALFLLGVLAFIAYGGVGFRAVVAPNEAAISAIPPSRFGDWMLATAEALLGAIRQGPSWANLRLPAFGGFSFERGTRVEGQSMRWVDEIVVVRRYNRETKTDETVKQKHWNEKLAAKQGPNDLELMKLGEAMAATYTNHLNRYLGKVFPQFELRISGWTNPNSGYHALIVKVGPDDAALSARKVLKDDLIYLLDMRTDYTATDLAKCLVFDDPRVTNDPMRGGENGLFRGITYRNRTEQTEDKQPHAPQWERTGDLIRDAVSLALAETVNDPGRFTFRERDESYGVITSSFSLQLRAGDGQFTNSAAAAADAVKQWTDLLMAVAIHAKLRPADLTFDYDYATQRFTIEQRVPPPPFPGDDPRDERVSLLGWVRDNAEAMTSHPRRFAAGLNYKGEPRWVDFGNPISPHALIVGAAGSGKTASGLLSPIVQLVAANSPDTFRLWLVDPKEELSALLGDLPHVERAVVPHQASDVLPLLDAFDAELRRRRDQGAYKWSPRTGDPWLLLVIEEWQALVEAAKGDSEQEKAVKAIAGRVSALAAIGRSAGGHVVLLSQKGTDNIVSSAITANLPVHIVGRSRAADYDQMLGTREVALDRSGKLALLTPDMLAGPAVVAGFVEFVGDRSDPEAVDRGIKRVLAEVVLPRWGRRVSPLRVEKHGAPVAPSGAPDSSFDPFAEDAGDAEPSVVTDEYMPGSNDPAVLSSGRFGAMEAASELFHWWIEVGGQHLIFSAGELIARLRDRYGKAPREQAVRAAINRLAELGVIEDEIVSGRQMRRLVNATWPAVKELIETRTEEDEPTDDRLFERRTAA